MQPNISPDFLRRSARRLVLPLAATTIALCTLETVPSLSAARAGSAVQARLNALGARLVALQVQYDELRRKFFPEMDNRFSVFPALCNGRLTTQGNTPFSAGNRTAQATLRFAPYQGNRIALYTGGRWRTYTFTQRNLPLAGLTTDALYDVFLYDNAATLTLELSAEWTDNSTRAEALAVMDGVHVKASDPTRRYLGTMRASSATTTEDANNTRYIWNYCNRMKRSLLLQDVTDSWVYNGTAWRQVGGSAANTVGIVIGLQDTLLQLRAVLQTGAAASLGWVSTGIGIDSTTVNSAFMMGASSNASTSLQVWADYQGYPGIGYHDINWLETTDGTSVTFYGDNGSGRVRSGFVGFVEG